jgi:hypothetical protein
MVYVIQVCRQLASRIRIELQFHPALACKRIRIELQFHPAPACKLSANLYDVYHCCVYSEKLLMMDRGNVRNM